MQKPDILIIEDNPLNLELVTDLLEMAGCQVRSASSAEAGLRLIEQYLPDMVLMDVSLPGLDGLATTKLIKTNPITRNLPIVAVTAHAMKGDQSLVAESGCDGYIAKPIDTRTFVNTVLGFLPQLRTNH